jgi:hypothetical protein
VGFRLLPFGLLVAIPLKWIISGPWMFVTLPLFTIGPWLNLTAEQQQQVIPLLRKISRSNDT